MNGFKPNGLQQIIMIITAGLLLYVSFNGDDIHVAKVLGIISASAFLVYGLGQIQIRKPENLNYASLKQTLAIILLITATLSVYFTSRVVSDSYRAKTEYIRYLETESKKSPEQIAKEKKEISTAYEEALQDLARSKTNR